MGRLIENKPSITTPCNARDEVKGRFEVSRRTRKCCLPDGRASMTYPVIGPAPSAPSDQ